MTFPTTGVLDAFTDANGTTLTAHNAKWILDAGDTAAQIQSNRATLNAAGVFSEYGWNETFGPGVETYIDFNTGTGTNRYVNVVTRATQVDPATTSGYLAEVWDNNTSTFVQLNFYRIDAGNNQLLNSQAISLADSTNHQLGLRSIDSTHRVYLDGIEQFSFEDSTYPNAGFLNLYFGQTTGTPLTLDDFGGDTLAASDALALFRA